MSGITSTVGLISGIDTGSLIEQLLQIEARPRTLAQQRLVQSNAFRALFNGNLQDTDYVRHHCSMGCDCVDEADSLKKPHCQIDEFILRTCQSWEH